MWTSCSASWINLFAATILSSSPSSPLFSTFCDLCPDSTPITITKTHSTKFTSTTHDLATMTRIELQYCLLFNALYCTLIFPFVTVKTLDKRQGMRMGTKVVIDLNVKCDKYLLCSIDAEKKSFSSVHMFTEISF